MSNVIDHPKCERERLKKEYALAIKESQIEALNMMLKHSYERETFWRKLAIGGVLVDFFIITGLLFYILFR